MGSKVILVKKVVDVEPRGHEKPQLPVFDTDLPAVDRNWVADEADQTAELEDLRLVEHLRRKGIRARATRADRGPLHQSRIQIIDRHTGKRGISREVSMVHHLIHMASEANITPEELVRSIIAESPEFRTEMAAFWSLENAGYKTPERGSK